MKNFNIKFREIFVPYLVISLITILSYNLLRWGLDVKLGVLPLKEDLLDFWIPFALPSIVVFAVMRRRICILSVSGSNDSGHFLYKFVMAMAIFLPLLISQNFIVANSFDLKQVQSTSEVVGMEKERCFEIESIKINEDTLATFATVRVSGRLNENLNFYLYITQPFEQDNAPIWHGVVYSKNLSNKISDDQKQLHFQSFRSYSARKYLEYDFQGVSYFEKLSYSDDRDGFIRAIQQDYPELNAEQQIFLVPRRESFADRQDGDMFWIFASYGIGLLILALMIFIPKVDEDVYENFKSGRQIQDEDLNVAWAFLNPFGDYKATALLLIANIFVFLLMAFFWGINLMSPTAVELLEVGGLRRFEVVNGEYWRLYTSMFLHGGLGHLTMNLIGLAIGGAYLEYIVRPVRFMIFYFFTGLIASLASILWYENTISVGASGAIFGIYGAIIAFAVLNITLIFQQKALLIYLGVFVWFNLLFGYWVGADNAAHLGGLISGVIIGFAFALSKGVTFNDTAS